MLLQGKLVIMSILAESATSVLPAEITPLINLGAIGCVLLWFMLRMEPRIRKLEESNDRLGKMLGYVVIALKSTTPAVREQVEQVIKEIDEAEVQRKK